MSRIKLDDKKLREIQMKHRGRFGGLKEKPKNIKGTLKKLLNYLASSKKMLVLLIIVVLFYTLCNLSTNIFIQKIIASLGTFDFDKDIWTTNPNFEAFITSTLLLASVYLLYCLLQYFSSYISAHVVIGMSKKMRNDLFAKIVKLPIKYTDTHPHGDIMSRMTNDVDQISNAISQSITSLVSGILTIIGCLAIMLYYSPLLTLVSMVTLLLSMSVTFLMSKFMRPLFVKQQRILGLLNSQTEEMVAGCKTVMAYNYQNEAKNEFNEYSNDLCKTGIKAQVWAGSMGPIMNFVGNVGHFLVCYFGALFVLKGIGNTMFGDPLTIAIVIMFVNTTKQFTRPINEIAHLYSSLITAMAGAERVFELIEEQTEDFTGITEFDSNNTKGVISFENVNFSYVEGKTVLNDFSLNINQGQKIALVGATGSGKTTIVNLLLRFYDVDSGTIKIDGIDINDISKKDLRDCISIVLQDAVLFEDTIENNVKYGKENPTQEEFENALKSANCYKFVNRLHDKEKTILTEGATNLSQGQRQLLTIARAILAVSTTCPLSKTTIISAS